MTSASSHDDAGTKHQHSEAPLLVFLTCCRSLNPQVCLKSVDFKEREIAAARALTIPQTDSFFFFAHVATSACAQTLHLYPNQFGSVSVKHDFPFHRLMMPVNSCRAWCYVLSDGNQKLWRLVHWGGSHWLVTWAQWKTSADILFFAGLCPKSLLHLKILWGECGSRIFYYIYIIQAKKLNYNKKLKWCIRYTYFFLLI